MVLILLVVTGSAIVDRLSRPVKSGRAATDYTFIYILMNLIPKRSKSGSRFQRARWDALAAMTTPFASESLLQVARFTTISFDSGTPHVASSLLWL